jgi:uncharacterized protein YjgD (DUF1641 family)
MAKPITHIEKKIPNPIEEQAESLSEILSLVAKNREAITTSLEILQELQSAGVLDLLKGFLKTREKVGVLAIQQINTPEMHNTIKNGINLLQLIGQIEPDRLKTLLHAANKGLESMGGTNDKISKWGLLKLMNDPDVLSSLSTMTGFLQGMGKELNSQKPLH